MSKPNAEAPLLYPLGEHTPSTGQATEVAPGVYWLRMGLPFALDHINLWLLRDRQPDPQEPAHLREGWTVVDCGIDNPTTREAWLAVESQVMQGLPVLRVIVTHMHPDHIGMAGWLTRKFDIRRWMTRLEYLSCRVMKGDTGREAPADAVAFYRRAGWSPAAIEAYRVRLGRFGAHIHALPESYHRLSDGDVLRIGEGHWRVIVGSGHSPEHACLYNADQGLLISGDQVLPRISSNVSVFPTEPDADPLGDWIDSIARLRQQLGDHLLVLPAHGEPFRGLHARLDRLAGGHERGLQRLKRSLAEGPKRAIDVFGALFARKIDVGSEMLGLATGESLAHLNHLIAAGEATATLDADGVRWYRLVA